jgi:hypothetical protein
MFNAGFDDIFFTSHFVNGLGDDIRGGVQSQLCDSMDISSLLACIQQQIVERSKSKPTKINTTKVVTPSSKNDPT